MARVNLLVELDIGIDSDDAAAGSDGREKITEDDLRDAAREAIAEALDFVQDERGFWSPLGGITEIKIAEVNLIAAGPEKLN